MGLWPPALCMTALHNHECTNSDIKKLPKCMAKIIMFMRLGIGNMSELMEKYDGMLCMITATSLRSRCPQAERMHVHLLHQTTAYLCRGQDIVKGCETCRRT